MLQSEARVHVASKVSYVCNYLCVFDHVLDIGVLADEPGVPGV